PRFAQGAVESLARGVHSYAVTVSDSANVAPWQPWAVPLDRWIIPAPRRLLSWPLTWSVECGAMIGQLEKFVGGVIVTYCLHSPAPCGTKSPVPSLSAPLNGHAATPHAGR